MTLLVPPRRWFVLLGLTASLLACEASKTLRLLPGSDGPDSRAPEASAGSPAVSASGGDDAEPDAAAEPLATGGSAGTAAISGSARETASTPLIGGLLHRYSFSGTGTTVTDSVGTAHGTVHGGGELDGSGSLTLDGVDDWVSLPLTGLFQSVSSITFVTWFTWHSGVSWERVFDFGATKEGLEQPGTSDGHFMFTPQYEGGPGTSANIQIGNDIRAAADGAAPFPTEQAVQIAVVFDGTNEMLETFIDGTSQAWKYVSFSLSELRDDHCWLGQSQWAHDAWMHGTYNEFRIYGAALTAADVRTLGEAGPDRP